MAIQPENPIRSQHIFAIKVVFKAKRYDEAFDRMEKLVQAEGYHRNQLTPDELRLFVIVFDSRVASLVVPKGRAMDKSDKAELVSVCMRILKLLDTILIPMSGSEKESKALYLKMKKECYWYLAEARDGTKEKVHRRGVFGVFDRENNEVDEAYRRAFHVDNLFVSLLLLGVRYVINLLNF